MTSVWKTETVSQTRNRLRRSWGDYPLTILVINPINLYLVRWVGRKTAITPNQLSLIAFLITLLSAFCLAFANRPVQITGGALLLVGFLLDCLDGDLARFKEMKSPLGAMIDPVFDRFGEMAVMTGVAIGGWQWTDDPRWLVAGIVQVGMSQIYFYLTDTMLNKMHEATGENVEGKPMALLGTRVRFGAIEPFIWGQAVLVFAGRGHWGVPVFGAMFSVCCMIQFYRLVVRAHALGAHETDEYSPHVKNL